MWSVILATLRMALAPLAIAEAMLRNLDANNEGVDDKAADGLRQAIGIIQTVLASDDSVPGQARGLVAITAFCRRVLTRLDEIIASGPPYDTAVRAEATDLFKSLFDVAKIYQAQRGRDAQVLSDAKLAAKEKLDVITQTDA